MTGAAAAAGAGSVSIVAPDEVALAALSVLDVRDASGFRAGHLPGARRFDWRDWTEERPGVLGWLFGDPARWGRLRGLDAPAPDLEARLSELGLANGRPILVVGAGGGWGEEGRAAWSLLAWGASDVRLLDGGFPAWRADGRRPVEGGTERDGPPARFRLAPRPERRILAAELVRQLDSPALVLLDARSAAEFGGERWAGQARGGHLPGARLVPESSLFRPDGRYVEAAELARLVGPLPPDAEIVTYCTGGVRSALLAILVEARLGRPVRNYDGSLWEWSARPELPLETGAGTR